MSEITIYPEVKELSILDESDEHSLINLVPKSVKKAMAAAAKSHANLFVLSEDEFLEYCKLQAFRLTTTDHMLRTQFWIEFHKARQHGKKMIMAQVVTDTCTATNFLNHYIENPVRMAWLCCQPIEYKTILRTHLARLAQNMGKIVSLDPIDPATGRLDLKVAQMQINLYKLLEVTIHGTPTQRIEQRNLNLNVTRNESDKISGYIEGDNAKSLTERIKQLEARERAAAHVPQGSEWQKMPVTNVKMTESKDD